jgi:DnaJ-domain-containing protein 1
MGFDPRTWRDPGPGRAGGRPRPVVTVGAAPGLTPKLVQRWGEAMARHPRWHEIRCAALEELINALLARRPDSRRDLEEDLERHCPGLGRELAWALRGPRSTVRLAVRAAFVLLGGRAADRLDGAPEAVVDLLLAALGPRGSGAAPAQALGPRAEALRLLGLPEAADDLAVKAAHRRLVKQHHPDRGGDAEAFRRIQAAYRLLLP